MPLKFGIFLEIVEDQTMGEPQMLSPLVLVAGDQGAADWADLLCALEFAISLVNLNGQFAWKEKQETKWI